MKVISIKQPWASLIVESNDFEPGFGIKPIENRTWPTKFTGRVLVHASDKRVKGLACEILSDMQYAQVFTANKLCALNGPTGAIIGSVAIVDCVLNHNSVWAEHVAHKQKKVNGDIFNVEVPVYNWVLANPIKFPEPIPAKGKLSFWDYPNILAEPEENDGDLFCHCQLPIKEINQVTGDSRFGYYCRYCGGKWYK